MAVTPTNPQHAGQSAQSFLTQGNNAMRNGDYRLALNLFQQALQQTPALAKVIEFNIGLVEKKIGVNHRATHVEKSKAVRDIELTSSTANKLTPLCIPVKTLTAYEGRLEKHENGLFRGWAVNKSKKNEIFELSIQINGVYFCKVKNHDNRADLLKAGKSTGKGGYSFVIPSEVLDENENTVKILFPDGCELSSVILPKLNKFQTNDIILLPVEEKVSVIVPIYNAVDDVEVCIERLAKYTPKDVDIILINDASPDQSIKTILTDAQKHTNIRVFHNQENLGFTKTVNRGIELAGGNDVILLNSDARVTPRWIQGFRRALATDYKIATVTAMSDRAGAFSAPDIGNENELPVGVEEEEYAVAFRRRGVGYYPTVPTGNGFCMYIRRRCINEIGRLDSEAFPRGYGEENDFCMRARAAGWRNVIDDRTYVFHDRSKSFGSEKDGLIKAGRKVIDVRYPDYKKATTIFRESPLINTARFKARQAIDDCTTSFLPRGLFVISTLTGGTPQTNRDLMLALSDRVEGWLLHCDSKVISLFRVHKDRPDELIRQHALKEHVEALTHYCSEYDRVVFNWLNLYDFEFVHIRHIAWHSLSLPRLAKQLGARVIKSFHDFYAICPTVKLLDGDNVFCEGKCTENSNSECKPELWSTESLPILKNSWVHVWRDKFSKALSFCDVFITTHESVRATISKSLRINKELFHVIPHGRDFDRFYNLAEPYNDGDVLKVLVPGNISTPKGSMIIEQILELDKEGRIHFHVLGNSNIKLKHPRLTFHGNYKRDEFSLHVRKIKPHLGAVLSIWNETWCHTLTELWSVGLPVIANNFETISSRVKEIDGGFLVEPNANLIYSSLVSEISDSKLLQSKVVNIVEASNKIMDSNTRVMSNAYWSLYCGALSE